MTTATPDKPETVPPAIHPVTRKRLEESLPFIREFLAMAGPAYPSSPELTRDAVDELRQGFPALDDLTLATMCTWAFDGAVAVAKGSPFSDLSGCMAFAEMAVELAWSLDTPEAPEAS